MKKSLLALTLLVAAPFAASAAEGVSYNYVEGGYAATNTDGADADGWGLNGSVAIAPNFHLFGGYSNQEIDDTSIDLNLFAGLARAQQAPPGWAARFSRCLSRRTECIRLYG